MRHRRKSKKDSVVRYHRLLNNLTVSELAYKTNIERIQLEKIECGTVPCSELNARRFAELFGNPYGWEIFVPKEVQA